MGGSAAALGLWLWWLVCEGLFCAVSSGISDYLAIERWGEAGCGYASSGRGPALGQGCHRGGRERARAKEGKKTRAVRKKKKKVLYGPFLGTKPLATIGVSAKKATAGRVVGCRKGQEGG
ncbi:hypothetical protein GQ53DRAFT_203345 [Thozetella sp. PMI_491]|nr:hypothetical protein GQ53DRAFT_203345 [Thozetella sp. PMI_491]